LLDPEGWSGLGERVVFGVAEAWGRVLIGTEGWRSRYSRAIALYVPPTSDLWDSDRLQLLSERYRIPIAGSLESLVAEWAPEPIELGRSRSLQLTTSIGAATEAGPDASVDGGMGPGTGSSSGTTFVDSVDDPPPERGSSRLLDRWPGDWPDHTTGRRASRPSDGASRIARQVAAVERLAGPGSKRILELGIGAGHRASPLAERGHSVVSVAGDFARIDLPGPFDVIGYLGGFGVGSDDEQRYLLRQIARWAGPGSCILVEVLTPWFWATKSSRAERGHGWAFDPDACRAQVRTSPLWDDASAVTQALRCYAPADLRMLLDGTGLTLDAVDPFAGEGYEPVSRLEDAKLYLAKLVPTR
jgi:SAM-dependent methyltransferase